MNLKLATLLILGLGLATPVVLAAIYDQPTVYLTINAGLWSVSWFLIAKKSLRDKVAGFPPLFITFTFFLEWIELLHPASRALFSPYVRIHHILWCFTTAVNLWIIYKYNWKEFTLNYSRKWFWPKFILENFIYLMAFGAAVNRWPETPLMLLLTISFLPLSSAMFFFHLFFRKNIQGISLLGNVARILASFMPIYQALTVYKADQLRTPLYFGVLFDFLFMIAYFMKKKKSVGSR